MRVLNMSSTTTSCAMSDELLARRAEMSLTTCNLMLPRGGSSSPTVVTILGIWREGREERDVTGREGNGGKGGEGRGREGRKGRGRERRQLARQGGEGRGGEGEGKREGRKGRGRERCQLVGQGERGKGKRLKEEG